MSIQLPPLDPSPPADNRSTIAIDDVLITNYAFSVSSDKWVSGFERIIG
ncbi:MAG: hypothetical protein ACOX1U_00295 [Saccharofermentanales bacterium]|nr:hypothetical protein [Clostridiaceae bacterium]